MNFQTIPPVEKSKDMLDLAFSKAREKGKNKNLKGNWLEIIRKKESLKLDVVKDVLSTRLRNILTSFPNLDQLPEFYTKLLNLTLDYRELKKSLASLKWGAERVLFFQKKYVARIFVEKERNAIKGVSKEFYGRASSVLKQINKHLIYLESCRKVMKSYPDIKDMFTVCVYGFPNVGKTTLLNELTGTKAETASYAFTTKSINSGHLKIVDGKIGSKKLKKKDLRKIQVLDVPGTLARAKLNPIEEQAELVLKELADIIVYVFDISGFSGYSLKKQEKLLKNLGRNKKILIYLSKTDLPDTQENLSEFKHKYYSAEEIKQEIKSIYEKNYDVESSDNS